jgi:hypothetical protein
VKNNQPVLPEDAANKGIVTAFSMSNRYLHNGFEENIVAEGHKALQ